MMDVKLRRFLTCTINDTFEKLLSRTFGDMKTR